MKRIALTTLLIPLLSVTLSCRGSLTTLPGGEEIEGWRSLNGEDYFYMRMPGSASELSVRRGDWAMMKSTCIESTRLQAQDRIIRKMLGEYQESTSQTLDARTVSHVVTSSREGIIKGTSIKECAPVSADSNWSNCECIHYVKGKNLKREFEFSVEKAREG